MRFAVGDMVQTKSGSDDTLVGFGIRGKVVDYFRDTWVAVDVGYKYELVPESELELVDRGNYADVGRFHRKFGLPEHVGVGAAVPLDRETFDYRRGFMQEELDEFTEAFDSGDLPKQADALIDLVYVAMGTAQMMNLPWQDLWDEVQRANLAKERAAHADDSRSKRKSSLDVVKPEGWQAPDIEGVLRRYELGEADRHDVDHVMGGFHEPGGFFD